ncbi:MAG: hypothetical protein QOG79_6914 [Mycobacterium sp.]|nr:hypothetical protein [Mycobacterium sp.]MDT5352401.1 hypothetical protein [Mycobacterium sp.]
MEADWAGALSAVKAFAARRLLPSRSSGDRIGQTRRVSDRHLRAPFTRTRRSHADTKLYSSLRAQASSFPDCDMALPPRAGGDGVAGQQVPRTW